MLVGNKSDRVTEREVSTQEGQALARELGCEFVEASAKNCINVEKAFYDVVRQLRRSRREQAKLSSGGTKGSRGDEGDRMPRSDDRKYRDRQNKKTPRCVIL